MNTKHKNKSLIELDIESSSSLRSIRSKIDRLIDSPLDCFNQQDELMKVQMQISRLISDIGIYFVTVEVPRREEESLRKRTCFQMLPSYRKFRRGPPV